MTTILPDRNSVRVLIFAPIGRDGPASAELLRRIGMVADVCVSLAGLVENIEAGAAAVFLAEEGLFGQDISALCSWVERQLPWSDLPFVVLTSHQEQPAVMAWRQRLVASLRNVSLLERPVQAITLASALQVAVRARRRQYEVRALLEAREQAAQDLEALVAARTRELEEANRELRTQMAERARAEESLRQAQKMEALGQLTGGVAHDFNNLLTVISGGLEMLDRQQDLARRQRLTAGMKQAVGRGAALTRQLLAFSRRQALKPEPVDLARRIEGMRELLDRSLGGEVYVESHFPPDLPPVEVDPGELELALLNLCVNARDAMPAGGRIVIRAENRACVSEGTLQGDFVCLSVADSGIGMSADVLARVFEPFFTTKDVGKGSGLGLPQVYGFAQQSGGSVRIDSEIGQGTTVSLLLPRSVNVPASPERCLDGPNVELPLPPISATILLVEDDDEVAALVTEMLVQLGFDVTRAASGYAALGALANGREIDVVFSDVMMPGGMNGVELARKIRRRRPGLPVLLTSGYPTAVGHEAEAEGVRLVPKPYSFETLARSLREVLGREHATKP